MAVDGWRTTFFLLVAAPLLLFFRPCPLVILEVLITVKFLVRTSSLEVFAAEFALLFRPSADGCVAVGGVIRINGIWAIGG